MPSHNKSPSETATTDETQPTTSYRPPRIDLEVLTIVVHPSPYSKRTPLARSRKPTIRRRWFS